MQSGGNDKALTDTWNLTPLFESDTDPEIEKNLEQTKVQITKFAEKWSNRQDYLTDSKILVEALNEYNLLNTNYGISGKAGFYFGLRNSQEQTNPIIKAQLAKIEEFSRKMINEIQFFELRLSKIERSTQSKFLAAEELKDYRHYLEKLFIQSKHLLSEAEEKIMNLKGGPAHVSWTRMTSAFLAGETRNGKNLSQLISDASSPIKKKRDKAAKYTHEIMAQYAPVAESELNAIMENKKVDDQLRGFERPDKPRHLSDDIDSSVVDAMTTAVSSRFDIPNRYYQLKAKLLGVNQLKYWERSVPYGKITQKYSLDQSKKLISKVFNKLDPKFSEIFRQFVEEGRLDVYPRIGKRGGAFCAADLVTLPVYILLNHTDKLHDVLTLAHEMGHGINDELMKKSQLALNFGSPLSTAEVASTFMEDFVLQELISRSNPKQRLALYVQKLDDDVSTIFRQVAAYLFEKELHASFRNAGYLPKDEIGKLFQTHMAAYMGEAVEQSEGSENYWVYWSHFRTFFYVYSYSSGLLISKSLQSLVKNEPKFIDQIKLILSAGSSDSPKNIFKRYANLDISDPNFWTTGIKEVELLLDEAERLWEEVK
jgi:oligoendopeptidase F